MISTAAWDRLCCKGEHLLCHDPIRWPSAFSEAWPASLSRILARSFIPQGTGFRVGTTHLEPASNRARQACTSAIGAEDSPRGHSRLRRCFVSIPPRSFPDAPSGGTSLAQTGIDGRSYQPLGHGGQHDGIEQGRGRRTPLPTRTRKGGVLVYETALRCVVKTAIGAARAKHARKEML